MAARLSKSGERLLPEQVGSRDEYLQYLRHVFAYRWAARELAGSGRVLDLGCGEGYGTRLLAEAVDRIVGLDVDKEVIAHAGRERASANCRFRRYDGRLLPLETGSFDAAVSFQVIEHVADGRAFASEAARVLRPGGRLLLSTPNRLTRLGPGARPWNRFHVREYGPADLAALLGRFFGEVRVCGITACPEVYGIEMARVRASRILARLDALGLRHLLPPSAASRLARLGRRILGAGDRARPTGRPVRRPAGWESRFAVENFFFTSDVRGCLDLTAHCRK